MLIGAAGSGDTGGVGVQTEGKGVSDLEIKGWSDGEYVIHVGSLNGSGEIGSRYLLNRLSDGTKSDGAE